jgi:uncharacterized protein YgiM (DUF1202 family)
MSRIQMLVIGIVVSLVLGMTLPVMAQTATPAVPAGETVPPEPTPLPLTASTDMFATSNFFVNVRSGPSTKYTVLGKIRPGDQLDITGRLTNNAWLRVNFNGLEGWVSAPLFAITGDLKTTPEAEAGATAVLRKTANQLATTQLGEVIVITRVNTNLRLAASVDADVLAVVPFDTQLTVTGRTSNSNWVQVAFENQTGWMSAGTLLFSQGNLANVTVLDESGNLVQPTAAP